MPGAERPDTGLIHTRPATRWTRSESALWRIVMDDLIVAAADGDQPPFAVSGGARLWTVLAESTTLAELAEELGAGARIEELEGLLDQLADAGVVERADR